ncbi:MAG: NADH dehydrogenase [Ignavibacteria bacterium GWB2_35_6b]|nr:MAG: NADH dehydrogenase [Ignavibacteria bacterium GWB2_35_6b]
MSENSFEQKPIVNVVNGGFDDNAKILVVKGILAQQSQLKSTNIQDYEFKVFSQFGDDGIIQFLINNTEIINKSFIEFGVEDYSESNTRFLLMNNNWSGFIMDGSEKAIKKIHSRHYFWKHDLRAVPTFITKENINSLMDKTGFEDIGLLHIDIDGNDYWIWEEIDISKLRPTIVILEYNSVFGIDKAITIPYKEDFYRTGAHYSNLYWGASLKALVNLSAKKGYSFVGCNSAGNNAYFVKNNRMKNLQSLSAEDGYVESKFRESRNEEGQLTFLRKEERLNAIKGLDVLNIENNQIERL